MEIILLLPVIVFVVGVLIAIIASIYYHFENKKLDDHFNTGEADAFSNWLNGGGSYDKNELRYYKNLSEYSSDTSYKSPVYSYDDSGDEDEDVPFGYLEDMICQHCGESATNLDIDIEQGKYWCSCCNRHYEASPSMVEAYKRERLNIY